MTKLWLLVVMAVPLQLIHSQEVNQGITHALTVEQCRADQKLWSSKLGDTENPIGTRFSFRELDAWWWEMSNCLDVDRPYHLLYSQLMGDISYEQRQWMLQFIDRHGLFHEFSVESSYVYTKP